jgi:hypothetical protein
MGMNGFRIPAKKFTEKLKRAVKPSIDCVFEETREDPGLKLELDRVEGKFNSRR